LPTFIFCWFSKPDWDWVMFLAVTSDLPLLAALPIPSSCLFSRLIWLLAMGGDGHGLTSEPWPTQGRQTSWQSQRQLLKLQFHGFSLQ
jgi:hypothetical protein